MAYEKGADIWHRHLIRHDRPLPDLYHPSRLIRLQGVLQSLRHISHPFHTQSNHLHQLVGSKRRASCFTQHAEFTLSVDC